MATPLGFLRKNSTGLMVILVILSMLVFTLDKENGIKPLVTEGLKRVAIGVDAAKNVF